MKMIIIYFFLSCLLLSFSNAATIYGTIYDLSITRVNNAIVEINTNPNQRYVAVNGTYQFEIPIGDYTITSYFEGMNAEENLTVVDDGIYILDLFLYPNLDEEEQLFEDLNFDIQDPYQKQKKTGWILFPIVLASVFLFFILKLNTKLIKKEVQEEIKIMDTDLNKILSLLKKNKGRMTQREIRKEFPLSEAKVSLMITELESMDKVKKIKKGRGNVIIFKK